MSPLRVELFVLHYSRSPEDRVTLENNSSAKVGDDGGQVVTIRSFFSLPLLIPPKR